MKRAFHGLLAALKRNALFLAAAAATIIVLILTPTIVFNVSTASSRYDAMETNWLARVPTGETAIVFGAGVLPDRTPTPYLKWRVKTAVELYMARKVHTIIMSGDNSSEHYNEPQVMGAYAVSLGVAQHDIVLDYAGFNTYDTCYRARYVFGIERATLVTQGYHLPRAVATCNTLGVKSVGVAAGHTGRDFTVPYLLREVASTQKASFQLLLKPQPTVLGNPEFITHE